MLRGYFHSYRDELDTLSVTEYMVLQIFLAWANYSTTPRVCKPTGDLLYEGEFCFGFRDLADRLSKRGHKVDHKTIRAAVDHLVKIGKIQNLKSTRMKGSTARIVELDRVRHDAFDAQNEFPTLSPLIPHANISISPMKSETQESSHSPLIPHSLAYSNPITQNTSKTTRRLKPKKRELVVEPKKHWLRQVEASEVKKVRDNLGEWVPYWKMPRGVLENFLPLFSSYEDACDFIDETLAWATGEKSGVRKTEVGSALVGRIINYTKQQEILDVDAV